MSETRPLARVRSSLVWRVLITIGLVGAIAAIVAATLASDAAQRRAEDRLVAEATAVGDGVRAALSEAGWPDQLDPDVRTRVGLAAAAVDATGGVWSVRNPAGQVLVGDDTSDAQALASQALNEGSTFLQEDLDADVVRLAVPLARRDGGGFVLHVAHPTDALRGAAAEVRERVLGVVGLATALLLITVYPLLRSHERRMTERAAAVEALLERERSDAAKLAEVDRLKNAFLTAVSHELRTPLTVIKGVGDLFVARAEQMRPEQAKMLAERMHTKVARLEQLLGDLLDIDRLARGVLEPRRRPTDLRLVASRVADDALTESHRFVLPEEPLTVDVDPGHVERIVENLVRNAVEYTPAGTTVTIALHRADDETRINVADDGPGIPPELRDIVFDPFTGGDPDGANPGLGGGLTLVKRLAEIHGGGAWLEDRAEGGTSVWVRLPDE